jgi:hypothetical protein
MASLLECGASDTGSNGDSGVPATVDASSVPERLHLTQAGTVPSVVMPHDDALRVDYVDSGEVPLAPIDIAINILVDKGISFDEYCSWPAFNAASLRDPSSSAGRGAGGDQWRCDNAHRRALLFLSNNIMRPIEARPGDFTILLDKEYSTLCVVENEATRVEITQGMGLCHMYAAAVVQYYAIWHYKLAMSPPITERHAIFDVGRHVRENKKGRILYSYIFDDVGVSSEDALDFILPGCATTGYSYSSTYESHLKEYGAGLLTGFRVYEDFIDTSIHSHYGSPSGLYLGLHAMVLVGVRHDPVHGMILLLQNWWVGKQLVEVNLTYFNTCRGHICFVTTPQTGVPAHIPLLMGMHFSVTW